MLEIEERQQLGALSWLYSEGIDLSRIAIEPIARSPLTFRVGGGIVVAYRYGAVVLFGVEEQVAREFLEGLGMGASTPFKDGDAAELRRADPETPEGLNSRGEIVLRSFDLASLRVVAEVLARSAILAYYEAHSAAVLLDLEGPVDGLRKDGRLPRRTRSLLRGIGEVLHREVHMIGRAEVSEKPDFVWDRPDLDRLYTKLADEYELSDRDRALTRKLDLAMRTISILIEALSARRTLNVEWAIFLLILLEVVLGFMPRLV